MTTDPHAADYGEARPLAERIRHPQIGCGTYLDPETRERVVGIDPASTPAPPRPTHLLHVMGRNIARETGIQPSPVVFRGTGDNAVNTVMLDTVRRCFRHRPDLRLSVEWTHNDRASVWVDNGRDRAEVAARFRLTPITPADIARVGAPPAKELLP